MGQKLHELRKCSSSSLSRLDSGANSESALNGDGKLDDSCFCFRVGFALGN
jgi:hypothetical protein